MTAPTKAAASGSEACEEWCICSLARFPSRFSDRYLTLSVACFQDFFKPDFCRRAKCAPRTIRHFRRVLDILTKQYVELGRKFFNLRMSWSQDRDASDERRLKLKIFCQYLEEDFQPGVCGDGPPRRAFRELWATANTFLNALAERGQHHDFECDFSRLQALQREVAAVQRECSGLKAIFAHVRNASRDVRRQGNPRLPSPYCNQGATIIVHSEPRYVKEATKWFKSLTQSGMWDSGCSTERDDELDFWRLTRMGDVIEERRRREHRRT